MAGLMSALRDHIKTCPFLVSANDTPFGVDFLDEDDTAYMIEAVPAPSVIKRYINGDVEKQLVFAFSTRESYGSDALQNLTNIEFMEEFSEWLEECTQIGNLPYLPGTKKSIKLEALTSGYAYQTRIDKAQYRIQCRLIYSQKGKSNG
jgi:hypothetical protein